MLEHTIRRLNRLVAGSLVALLYLTAIAFYL